MLRLSGTRISKAWPPQFSVVELNHVPRRKGSNCPPGREVGKPPRGVQPQERQVIQGFCVGPGNSSSDRGTESLLPLSSRWWDDRYNINALDLEHKGITELLWEDRWYNPGRIKPTLEEKETGEVGIRGTIGSEAFDGQPKQEQLYLNEDPGLVNEFVGSDHICEISGKSGVQMDASKTELLREGSAWQNWQSLSLEDALSILDHMAVVPSVENFICILQKCRKKKDLAHARHVHAHVRNNGLEAHRAVGNYLVPMFVECGSLLDAQQVFNRLGHRNEHSWTALILGYIQCGQLQHALNLYQKMQEELVHPSSFTLVPVLKACATLKDVHRGREIHVEIAQQGLETELFVGSTLVSMYGKCGLLSEAQEVFAKLPVQDVVSWNALIAGYAQHGFREELLKCFVQMQMEGLSPDAATFLCVLKASSIEGIIEKRKLHNEITQKGFERNALVGNTLVDVYVKCGSLSEAQEVFDKLPFHDVVSWNALMAGYVEHGLDQATVKCLEQMCHEGVFPDAVTFVCALKVCSSIGEVEKGGEFHVMLTKQGFESFPVVGNTLVDMYAKCASLLEAQEVFDRLQTREVVSWTALIGGYAEDGACQEALQCFEQMQLDCVLPNAVTFVCILKACGSIGAIDKGHEINREIVRKGFERELFVLNSLIDMYAKCGSLWEAQEVFDKLPVHEVVSWTALIAGYAEHGLSQEALKCFELMQLEGILPDPVAFVCAVKACSGEGAIEQCQKLHLEIARKEFERHSLIGNALIDMYVKCGSLSQAREVFERLPVRDVVSWNALVAGYAEYGTCQETLEFLKQMQVEGAFPNAFTIVCILKACTNTGAINIARDIHIEITERAFERDVFVGSTLVDMYAKCGSLSEAQEVFAKLPNQDVVSWNAAIAGYAMNHEENMALQCFEDMQEQGVKPNGVTFTCLLTACSNATLLCKGQEYFTLMIQKYDIAATVDHYTCIVDLLARSGCLYEAERFLKTIPHPLSEGMWRALLGGCKTYGEVGLGLRCFEQIVKISPKDASSYVLMGDIYANAGLWDDAYRVEELRKNAGVMKRPASALIEVNKQVHEFVIGDNYSKEISAMLDTLNFRMEKKGHVPNLDLVLRPISDEGKGGTLCEHVEKVAIAFGLLNVPQGQTLRVTKNLRMCNDCHNASKIISKMERREIIVRDICCIHYFRDGVCSCGDMF